MMFLSLEEGVPRKFIQCSLIHFADKELTVGD